MLRDKTVGANVATEAQLDAGHPVVFVEGVSAVRAES